MVKLTIVGRASDGLPLAQGSRYVNEEDDSISIYKQQGEFLLKEISRGALPQSKMTIFLNDHCFNYMVENGVCFMTLCDVSYPRKLAFCYLQDLKEEFKKFDVELAEGILKPYGFIRFDGIIGKIKRKYIDTRTQTNLSKLNSDCFQEFDVESESFSEIVKRRRGSEMLERISVAHMNTSPIWCSKRLEIIALKWMPIGIVIAVATVLVYTSLIDGDEVFYNGF